MKNKKEAKFSRILCDWNNPSIEYIYSDEKNQVTHNGDIAWILQTNFQICYFCCHIL